MMEALSVRERLARFRWFSLMKGFIAESGCFGLVCEAVWGVLGRERSCREFHLMKGCGVFRVIGLKR